MFQIGWLVIKWPPHFVQYMRSLRGVLLKEATYSEPDATRTFSGFHMVKAFTGLADQDLHELQ